MRIYRAEIIDQIQTFYGDLLYPKREESINDHLCHLASKMYEGIKLQKACIFTQLTNYHPDHLGKPLEDLAETVFQLSDCQYAIANEYGFNDWNDVSSLGSKKYNMNFESCVNSIISGDFSTLESILKDKPSIINLNSQYRHRATLLHYTGSNGIEIWRQQVPQNLPEIVKLLLDNGAKKNATMNVYGGKYTTLQLLSTSAHAKNAGLLNELIEVFESYG